MNFFDGSVEGGTLRADGFDYDLTERMQRSVNGRTDVVLGARPEDISLHDDAASSHEFEAVIDVVEPMGSISYVYLKAVNQEREETFIVETDGQRPLTEGEHVYVEIPDEDIHLFDAESGETIHQRRLDEQAEVALEERMQTVSGSSD